MVLNEPLAITLTCLIKSLNFFMLLLSRPWVLLSVIIIVQSQPEAGNGKTENIFMKNRPIVSKPQFIAIKYLNLSTTKFAFSASGV